MLSLRVVEHLFCQLSSLDSVLRRFEGRKKREMKVFLQMICCILNAKTLDHFVLLTSNLSYQNIQILSSTTIFNLNMEYEATSSSPKSQINLQY